MKWESFESNLKLEVEGKKMNYSRIAVILFFLAFFSNGNALVDLNISTSGDINSVNPFFYDMAVLNNYAADLNFFAIKNVTFENTDFDEDEAGNARVVDAIMNGQSPSGSQQTSVSGAFLYKVVTEPDSNAFNQVVLYESKDFNSFTRYLLTDDLNQHKFPTIVHVPTGSIIDSSFPSYDKLFIAWLQTDSDLNIFNVWAMDVNVNLDQFGALSFGKKEKLSLADASGDSNQEFVSLFNIQTPVADSPDDFTVAALWSGQDANGESSGYEAVWANFIDLSVSAPAWSGPLGITSADFNARNPSGTQIKLNSKRSGAITGVVSTFFDYNVLVAFESFDFSNQDSNIFFTEAKLSD